MYKARHRWVDYLKDGDRDSYESLQRQWILPLVVSLICNYESRHFFKDITKSNDTIEHLFSKISEIFKLMLTISFQTFQLGKFYKYLHNYIYISHVLPICMSYCCFVGFIYPFMTYVDYHGILIRFCILYWQFIFKFINLTTFTSICILFYIFSHACLIVS